MFLKGFVSTWIETTWCFSTTLKSDGFPKEMQLEDSLNLKKKETHLVNSKTKESIVPDWMTKNGCSLWLSYGTFLNKLNLQIQDGYTIIIKLVDALKAFISKLLNWKRKIRIQNYLMFEKFRYIS